MSDKSRYVILNWLLVLICRASTGCEFVKEDTEERMLNSFLLDFKEHSAFIIDPLIPYIVQLEGDQEFPPKEFETKLRVEFHFPSQFIKEEVRNFYYYLKKIVSGKDAFDKKHITELYYISNNAFATIFTSKDRDHSINHISNEYLKTLYFECGQNILDSWKKLYDYSRTGSSKDKKEFLKTSEKLEDSLLILYQGMLGEHGSDSDILQAVKTHNQDYRESFVSDMRMVLAYLNLASVVVTHSYHFDDSRSLSDWSKTMIHLLQKDIQVKQIVFLTSIEWANQKHVKEKLIEIVKNHKNVENRVLADVLYDHLTSKHRTEYWFVVVYDALDEIDEGGKVSLVGIHHHVFQVGGKIILAFHQSKFMTNLEKYVIFKREVKLFDPIERIGSHCADGNFNLKPHDILDLLRTDDLYDEYSIIVLPPKTNSHYYYSDESPGFYTFESFLKGNLYSLFFVKSYSLSSEPENPFETPKTRSRSEL